MPDGQSEIELTLNINRYLRNADLASRAARKVDTDLENLGDSASDAGRELNALGKGVNIKIKVQDAELRDARADVDALGAEAPNVKINVDFSEALDAETVLNRVDNSAPAVNVNATYSELTAAEGVVEDIDAAAPVVPVSATYSELTTADALVTAIGAANPTVNIDVDANGKADVLEVRDALQRIQGMAKIEFVFKGAAAMQNIFASITGAPLVSTMNELNAAAREFATLTGTEPTGAIRDIIQGEFSRGMAETPLQVAETAAALDVANQAGENLSGSLQSIFDFARVSKKEVQEITNAAIGMVAAGLADDIPSAIDQMAGGFTTGADRAGDMLDAVTEFGPKIAEAGLNGTQGFELFNQALQAGAQNAGRVGEVFNELQNTLGTIGEGAGSAVFDALDKIGGQDLIDQGALVAEGKGNGAAFAASVMEGINEQITSGAMTPIEGDALITAIFGSPVPELGLEVFKGIDWNAVLSAEMDAGAVEAAVAPVQNGFVAAAQELGRVLEFEIADKFRIAGQPLQTLLDNAPAKMRELAELIRGGEGIPEALEIVLDAPGLADSFHDFEMGIADIFIGFIDALAKVVAMIPGADSGPLESTVANLATGQLPFQLVNADTQAELEGIIKTAWDRGVTVSGFETAVTEAVNTLRDDGQLIAAEQLIARAEAVADGIGAASTEWSNSIGPIVLASGGETIPGFDTAQFTEAEELVENARLGFDDYAVSVRKAGDDALLASVDSIALNTQLAKSRDVANEIAPRVDTVTEAYGGLEEQTLLTGQELSLMAEAGVEGLGGLVTAVETESPKLLAQWEGYRAMLVSVGDAAADAYFKATQLFNTTPNGYTPGTTPPTGPAQAFASGGNPLVNVPAMVGESGPEWASFARGATILNNQTTDAIIGGLAALLSGGYGVGGQNITNANMSVVINTQSNAAAIGAGGRVADSMRGMFG